MDNGFKFTSYFKLYDPTGLQISFNVAENTPEAHLENLDVLLNTLYARNYRQNPEDTEPGERVQEIDGWILAKNSNDQLCIYLYKSPLQFRITTIWQENIDKLPIKIPANLQPMIGSAPEIEVAKKMKLLQPCNFKIVLAPERDLNGQIKLTDHGNPRMRFNRMYGEASNANNVSNSPNQGGKVSQEPSSLSEESSKMISWARKLQGGKKDQTPTEELSEVILAIDSWIGMPGSGGIVLEVLTGLTGNDLVSINRKITNSLKEWVPVEKNGQPNPKHNENYAKALTDIYMASGKSKEIV